MATALDIAKRNPNAASVAVSDAARASGPDLLAIEKKAELSAAPGTALFGTSDLVGDLSRITAWVINLAVAEWIIRRTTRRPRLGRVSPTRAAPSTARPATT